MSENESLPDALRWQLRTLRRDEAPGRDLWPGIAARLQQQTVPTRHRPRWQVATAVAASLLLVVGVVGSLSGSFAPSPTATETLVQREADGMTRQYHAAMQELAPEPMPIPAALRPAFHDLDRNAALIREALQHAPDSPYLLEQLRRTYARRLALAQRAYT